LNILVPAGSDGLRLKIAQQAERLSWQHRSVVTAFLLLEQASRLTWHF
jgi:hypothetical protein